MLPVAVSHFMLSRRPFSPAGDRDEAEGRPLFSQFDEQEDHHTTLGITQHANSATITNAYRTFALLNRPDKVGVS